MGRESWTNPARLACLIHADVPDAEACLKKMTDAVTVGFGNNGIPYIKNLAEYQCAAQTTKNAK